VRGKRKRDIEGEILAMGWDTESASGAGPLRMMAKRGPQQTEWKADWQAVLEEVFKLRAEQEDPLSESQPCPECGATTEHYLICSKSEK
jgi:hypothetical protein